MKFFPGFTEERLPGEGCAIFARTGGSGPPVLLLHGFPQTHLAWRRIAPALAARCSVVAADLRGYGASGAPPDDSGHRAYSKRVMAADMVSAMRALGHERFAVVGHDRGARVAYRMALDHPERVVRLGLLEIVPTAHVWRAFDAGLAMKTWHWSFLAQPAPLPERLIAADPTLFQNWLLSSWTRDRTLRTFEDGALQAYNAAFASAGRIAAYCADYRAGAGVDREQDESDLAAGRRIAAPTLLIHGTRGFPAAAGDPLALWRAFCDDVRAVVVDCGHFPAEEAPEATAATLIDFLGA